MPLDPSIFMQGSAIRSQNNANLVASLQNSIKGRDDYRLKAAELGEKYGTSEAQAKDIAAKSELAFYKKANGEQTTPVEDHLANIYVATQQKYGFNPTTQAPMALPNALENLLRAGGGSMPASDTPGVPQIPPQSASIVPVSAGALQQYRTENGMPTPPVDGQRASMGLPVGESTNTPNIYDTLNKFITPATPSNNPAAAQTAIDATTKAKVDLQKELAQSDIDASKAGASKYADTIGEGAANQQLKDKGLTDLSDNIDRLIKDSAGTPSGVLQGAAATVTSKAGYPNKQAVASASFDAGKGILGLQSRLAFLKGQGAISNQEATQALSFLPDVNDAAEIKKAKLNKAKEYIGGLISKAPMVNGNAPGFKYLGVKQ